MEFIELILVSILIAKASCDQDTFGKRCFACVVGVYGVGLPVMLMMLMFNYAP